MAITSTTSSIICYNLRNLRETLKPRDLVFTPYICFPNSQNRKRFGNKHNFIREVPRGLGMRRSLQPGAPFPPEPPSGSWTKWIIGALLTFAIPFLRNKWGPFLMFTKKVETTIEKVDDAVEIIEEVAKKVDKVAEEIGDELPQGGKLKGAIEFIENAAEEVVKDAQFVDEILDKVEEIDKELDAIMSKDNGTAIPEEIKDKI